MTTTTVTCPSWCQTAPHEPDETGTYTHKSERVELKHVNGEVTLGLTQFVDGSPDDDRPEVLLLDELLTLDEADDLADRLRDFTRRARQRGLAAATTGSCPAWCRTDHDAEARECARRQVDIEGHLQAIGEPTTKDRLLPDVVVVHRQEVGRFHVCGRDGSAVPVVVQIEQVGSDEPALVNVVAQDAYFEDAYFYEEARALAALLVVAAQVLEA